ncbi:hypothetical protein [Nocardia abscessus]|uniref:hypothetical protein n=1 Tax=Nocardia abscessus TaxID=120957 RepID=UPI0006852B5A|nr:hypothetical protein [Nocardia abscessus]MCC3328237.1 hypothetical protein [Nocardia abscessus]
MFDSSQVRDSQRSDGTTAAAPLTDLPRTEQLALLRARMDAIHGRVGAREAPPMPSTAPAHTLPIPGALGDALPAGGLPRGSLVACTGRLGPLLGLLAAATAAGEWTAVLGCPRLGLLAIAEMGGNLARLAHIPDPGDDPLDIAAVLLDGLPLVVLDHRSTPAAGRTRAVLARIRSHEAILVTTHTGWARPDLEIHTELVECEGIGRGRGRLRSITYTIHVSGRVARHPRSTSLRLDPAGTQRSCWTRRPADSNSSDTPISRIG